MVKRSFLPPCFSAVFIEEDNSDIPKCESKTNVKCPDPIFDECGIQLKLSNLNPQKSTGIDNVHPRVLKECSVSLSVPFSIIFNKSYADGILPDLWLDANVTPLFKKGDK